MDSFCFALFVFDYARRAIDSPLLFDYSGVPAWYFCCLNFHFFKFMFVNISFAKFCIFVFVLSPRDVYLSINTHTLKENTSAEFGCTGLDGYRMLETSASCERYYTRTALLVSLRKVSVARDLVPLDSYESGMLCEKRLHSHRK